MNKQTFYEEQRAEGMLRQQIQQFNGVPALSPLDFNDTYGFGGAPRSKMTIPAGVYATSMDVGKDEYPDYPIAMMVDLQTASNSQYLAIALALVGLYVLFKPSS